MSYSSETEISDEEVYSFDTSKKEESEQKRQGTQPVEPVPAQVYSAIILENDVDIEIDPPQRIPPTRRYFTRSKTSTKDEPSTFQKPPARRPPLEYDEDEEELSEENYSEHDDVFVAQQINNVAASNKKDKKQKKPKEFKRARRSALPWTTAESKTLSLLVNLYGAKEWQFVAKILQSKHNNNRTAAQCSQRWCRVINPIINKGAWDLREDKLLCDKYDDLQGSWCKIVKFFPDRTDTQCKRRYEKILQMRNR